MSIRSRRARSRPVDPKQSKAVRISLRLLMLAFFKRLGTQISSLAPEPEERAGFTRTVVCLANSRKRSGRCLAGKVASGEERGRWIRPVSDRPDQEICLQERCYPDKSEPQLLDLIEIPLQTPRPNAHQTENWLIQPHRTWRRAGRTNWKELLALEDHPHTLWKNHSSTHHGLNDRVSLADRERLNSSLYLLHLWRLKLWVFTPGAPYGKPGKRVQADFRYQGTAYRMWVTDPVIESGYSVRSDGEYAIAQCFITVSLSEPLLGYCYKLVAAVIPAEVTEHK
jgi:hypothetical protein